VNEIRAEAIRISNMVFLSAHLLSHFLGKLSTATFPCPHPRKLSWWREHLFKWNGNPLKDKSDQVTSVQMPPY